MIWTNRLSQLNRDDLMLSLTLVLMKYVICTKQLTTYKNCPKALQLPLWGRKGVEEEPDSASADNYGNTAIAFTGKRKKP